MEYLQIVMLGVVVGRKEGICLNLQINKDPKGLMVKSEYKKSERDYGQ